MKKLMALGSALGAGLLQILARGGWETIGHSSPNRSTRAAKPGRSLRFMRSAPTNGARHWHNPADPVQAVRIEAAVAKREGKAEKLHLNTYASALFQKAHLQREITDGGEFHYSLLPRLNPFHIAK